MGNHCYQIKIADAVWDYESPIDLIITDNCKPFITNNDKPNFCVTYRIGFADNTNETIVRDGNPIVWKGHGYYRIERLLASALRPQSCYYYRMEKPFIFKGLVYPGEERFMRSLERLIDVTDLELQLAQLNAMSLHSSFIIHGGKAIVFTAPSGTGKSTQAELWEKYQNAVQINGDRCILRKRDGVWCAYGSPFSGTSGIFRNESAPIKAIVVLRQDKQNSIRLLKQSEAFRYVYSETVVPKWNKEIHTKLTDIISRVVEDLPVVMLSCRPDQSAVDLLNRFLMEELNDC